NKGFWSDVSIGITGRKTGCNQIEPKESVEFVAPVRTSYGNEPLQGTQIRASIYIYADADDPNGRKISSAALPFPIP
ncbi:MAG TPA: hypothetical protein VFG14_17095, partial [Chthoniobacteraceae bacterium]|nr:hypothetical protein [Chthoniobacteraceae bacterium]